jgi:hypothetical protein
MNRLLVGMMAFAWAVAGSAQAEDLSQAFGKCLVAHTSAEDHVVVVQWVFIAMSRAPALRGMSNVTPEQSDRTAEAVGKVVDRLVLHDCHAEAVAAVRANGPAALHDAFEVFGKIGLRDVMSDPAVTAELGKTGAYVDQSGWTALMEEGAPAH